MKLYFVILGLLDSAFCCAAIVKAQQEIGHFAPGVLGIRDFVMPAPCVYGGCILINTLGVIDDFWQRSVTGGLTNCGP